jgi:precorrin-2 dehydrogenase/sirohydrochlorin ferrochelatase
MPYPVSLNIKDKLCVVVGGGNVSVKRVRKLRANGARVRVIALDSLPVIAELESSGDIELLAEIYKAEQLSGAFLVIAATNNPAVNDAICKDAKSKGILACRADSNGDSDFSILASVDRGDLSFAISTSGKSPTLSAVIKQRIETEYGPEWDTWTALFGRLRGKFQDIPDESGRLATADRLLGDKNVQSLVINGELKLAEQEALRCF